MSNLLAIEENISKLRARFCEKLKLFFGVRQGASFLFQFWVSFDIWSYYRSFVFDLGLYKKDGSHLSLNCCLKLNDTFHPIFIHVDYNHETCPSKRKCILHSTFIWSFLKPMPTLREPWGYELRMSYPYWIKMYIWNNLLALELGSAFLPALELHRAIQMFLHDAADCISTVGTKTYPWYRQDLLQSQVPYRSPPLQQPYHYSQVEAQSRIIRSRNTPRWMMLR